MNILKAYEDTESKIDKLLINNQKILQKSIKKLEKKIIGLAAFILEITKAGDIKAQRTLNIKAQRTLASAIKFHKELIKEFELIYGNGTRDIVYGFSKIEKIVMKEFKALDIPLSFTVADKDMFKALQSASISSFQNLGADALDKMAQGIYDSVILGLSFNEFTNTIKKHTAGLQRYAEVRAHDSLMNYYSRLNVKKAADADVNTFLYYGDIIQTSRAFCIARVGNVFTVDEIKEWSNPKWHWQGKKPGSVLINRGGFNCRHSWHPCQQKWIDNGDLDIQSWYNEDRKMGTSLLKEVQKEKKLLNK